MKGVPSASICDMNYAIFPKLKHSQLFLKLLISIHFYQSSPSHSDNFSHINIRLLCICNTKVEIKAFKIIKNKS